MEYKDFLIWCGLACVAISVVVVACLAVLFIRVTIMLLFEDPEVDAASEVECNHFDSQYDEGHPDYPWLCNICGKRH